MCDRILGVNHPTTATIRENLVILQRQSTSRAIWKRRLGQFVQILLAMSTMVTERLVSAVEPCRTPTGILLTRASPRVVRAMTLLRR
ncbi:hypothetical protein PQG02_18105 [Nostoc sp. UHCC 0926]|uniref:hypothetical protein n=1 Tax=Nostoc sp. TaxID=1180 RepID=UPI0027A582B2|nr:hypothetical protein PQG02_18105 [Nostoc sp. UHCC 0926]